MLSKSYLFIFLISNAIRSGSTVFKSYYGIKIDEYPKESCHRIVNIRSKGQCLATCEMKVERIVMISHDVSTKICMCCSNITGRDITGPTWKSYVPRTLPWSGCTTYNFTSHQLCIKYFPVRARYSSAKNLCQAESGNLIKIDSQEKYDMFKEYHGPVADIQVWVQGEKVGGRWQFDDGTLIPNFCEINESNKTEEIHLRAYGFSSFSCGDAPNSDLYHYTCVYQRPLSITT